MMGRIYIAYPPDHHGFFRPGGALIGDTMGLVPGFYRAKLADDAPFVPVHAEMVEVRDEVGDLMEDVVYRLRVDGDYCLDWGLTYPRGLKGEPISEAEYRDLVNDRRHLVQHMGVHSNPKKPIDLLSMPSILPPGF